MIRLQVLNPTATKNKGYLLASKDPIEIKMVRVVSRRLKLENEPLASKLGVFVRKRNAERVLNRAKKILNLADETAKIQARFGKINGDVRKKGQVPPEFFESLSEEEKRVVLERIEQRRRADERRIKELEERQFQKVFPQTK